MTIEFKPATPDEAAEYVRLRGLTRENPISEERLRALGITADTWANDIRSATLLGVMCHSNQELVGYCFGNSGSGEILVLAVRPAFEGRGIGQRLLALVAGTLRGLGHTRLFLACSPDPTVRSYGFYRHLGWRSTGAVDEHGDEVLEMESAQIVEDQAPTATGTPPPRPPSAAVRRAAGHRRRSSRPRSRA